MSASHPGEADAPVSAWEAVAQAQKQIFPTYQLIRQPDHARLAAELAEHINFADGVALEDGIVAGIAMHDEGWTLFDDEPENYHTTAVKTRNGYVLNIEGKPISFLDVRAADAVRAWYGSIEAAEMSCPIAGLLVSHHFVRIARFGLAAGHYSEGDFSLIETFLAAEEARQNRLQPLQRRSKEEVQYWTDVLQFCDLLSLYLCCGSEQYIEFPPYQVLGATPMTAKLKNGNCTLFPALLGPCRCSLGAHCYPPSRGAASILSWRIGQEF